MCTVTPHPLAPMVAQEIAPVVGVMLKFVTAVAGPARTVRLLKALTVFVTHVVQGAGSEEPHGSVSATTRANSRAPLVIETYVNSIREKSMRPNSNSRNRGTTIANSGSACARRRCITRTPSMLGPGPQWAAGTAPDPY